MSSIPNVDGDYNGSLGDHYRNSEISIKSRIDQEEKQTILTRDTEELVEYYVQDLVLPQLQIDESKEPVLEEAEPRRSGGVSIYVGHHLIPEEGIDKVVSRRSNPYTLGDFFELSNCRMMTRIEAKLDQSGLDSLVKRQLESLKTIIDRKNQNVIGGNKQLRDYAKRYIEQKKSFYQKQQSTLEALSEKLNIKLQKKEDAPIIDLKIKKKIRMVMPEPRKQVDAELEQETLETIIELIRNQGRQFENTPKVFAKFEEEELRDIILGNLNSVFPDDATGESFVVSGKTDIRLKHNNIEGGILTSECKFWSGEQMYRDTIDQHFSYLAWKLDFAIQITFSKNTGFTDVLENAKNASRGHSTYIPDSLREIDSQHFVTEHTFPDDSKKKVLVHHLLFNLHVRS